MIPPSFDYARPSTVDEAVAELAGAGEDAKVLAGGQSLLPLLRLRLAYPSTLVDVGRIGQLRGVRLDGDTLVIGAMTTHHDVLRDPLVLEHCAVLAQATATVADPAVRHRGTLGGWVGHGAPRGDRPAVGVAVEWVL
jgi:carbon-monoxide dehydrogenase medium subunit